ncbi:MAG: hypothetical protein KC416_08680, partial [Myxococcales bacterium]|nr:hypothetical protein [Myxococcales bacterium]
MPRIPIVQRFLPCFVLVVPILCSGCFDNISSEFPPELEPLEEENRAALPSGEDFPEELSLSGKETDDYYSVHARGYVQAPIDKVYEAASTPLATVDRREVDKWTIEGTDEGNQYCVDLPQQIKKCHVIQNQVDDIITVEFDVAWRFGGEIRDEDEALERAHGRWQKVWGSEVLELLEGSIVLLRVSDEVTE